MPWLDRIGSSAPRKAGAEDPEREASPHGIERSAPGIAALFADLQEDGSHTVLDLGAAAESNFRLYSRFARRIRFADLLTAPMRGESWEAALQSLPPPSERPYDLVLAWNLLDRIPPEQRTPLVARLAQVTTSGARLYVLVDASGNPNPQPLHFTIHGMDRVGQQAVGDPYTAWPELLPAEAGRLLRPFQVAHAYTLRLGFREYVAVRE